MERDRTLLQQMIDPSRIGDGSPAGQSVNFVSFIQQEFSQVGSILAGDACNQSFFHILVSSVFHHNVMIIES